MTDGNDRRWVHLRCSEVLEPKRKGESNKDWTLARLWVARERFLERLWVAGFDVAREAVVGVIGGPPHGAKGEDARSRVVVMTSYEVHTVERAEMLNRMFRLGQHDALFPDKDNPLWTPTPAVRAVYELGRSVGVGPAPFNVGTKP